MRPPRRSVAGLALALGLAGCGGEPGPPRLPVSGTVTLDGRPLPSGAITLLPAREGPAAGGSIEDGRFVLGTSDGPGAGPYRVEIVSVRPTGKRVKDPDGSPIPVEEVRNVIPTRYNIRTELRVEVKPDAENAFTFALTSLEPARPRRAR